MFDASIDRPGGDPSAYRSSSEQADLARDSKSPRGQISQLELRGLQQLRTQKKQLDDLYDRRRADLIKKLRSGYPIEPGSLFARLDERKFRYLSVEALTPILGKDETDRLQGLVVPRVFVYVEIEERS